MIKKQVMLGAGLMTAGAIMMAAMFKQPKEEAPVKPQDTLVNAVPSPTVSTITPSQETASLMGEAETGTQIATPEVQPLTVDAGTETKILQDKEQKRQANSEQTLNQNSDLMAQKHSATELAIAKAQNEEEKIAENLKVQTRPESVQLAKQQQTRLEQEKAKKAQEQKAKKEKELKAQEQKFEEQKAKQEKAQKDNQKAKTAPRSYVVQAGDNLIRLSKEYNIPVSAIAEANNMGRHDALQRGRTIKLPTAKEVKELQAKAEKREQERLAKIAAEQKRIAINERLAQARQDAKKQGINDNYSVQVALATDQAKADEVANGYKKAGYSKVRTVKEARGVRVIVGTERSKEAAIALKDKINNDSSVKSDGAWVISGK